MKFKEKIMANKTHNDPMKHKGGKPRLGPLNVTQLEAMLKSVSRPKDKSKIQNRLRELKSRKGYTAPVETANDPA
jgi:hypothetical protein